MTPIRPTINIYAEITGSFVTINSYVVSDIKGVYGMLSGDPTDLVAMAGTTSFLVDNSGNEFTLGHASCFSGFGKGTVILLEIIFDGRYKRLRGYIDTVLIDSLDWGDQYAQINVVDFMEYFSNRPIVIQASLANETISTAVDALVTALPIQPQNTNYAAGVDTFPTVFDNVGTKTKVMTEIMKLALSEFAPVYIRKDPIYGETLVVEDRHSRLFSDEDTKIPVQSNDAGALLSDNNGFVLLQENGNPILLDQITDVNFADINFESAKITPSKLLLNDISISAYPKRIDTTSQTLYNLSTPFFLGVNESKKFKAIFIDPDGGGTPINGTDIDPLVTGTHYQMNTNSAGTGLDLTSSLLVSNSEIGSSSIFWNVTNSGTVGGWVTRLRVTGLGVYPYEPETFESSLTVTGSISSINRYGSFPLSFDQKYQSSYSVTEGIGSLLCAKYNEDRTILESIKCVANINANNMMAFMTLDLGDRIPVEVSNRGINASYYISGISFRLNLGGYIDYEYSFTEVLHTRDYWRVGVSHLGTDTVVGI